MGILGSKQGFLSRSNNALLYIVSIMFNFRGNKRKRNCIVCNISIVCTLLPSIVHLGSGGSKSQVCEALALAMIAGVGVGMN